jgi:hypothetical protein
MYSPLHSVSFIRDMLRQMFLEYGGEEFCWSEDERESKIRIGTVNDFTTDSRVQQTPRILIQRGACGVSSQFLGDNLESTLNGGINRGGHSVFRQDVNGSINIIIEALHEGTCEEIAEYVRRFICWSKPFIESTFGFQAFGKQVQVSACEADQEDTEKFKISISIPFIIEDRWKLEGQLTRLNHIFHTLTQTLSD